MNQVNQFYLKHAVYEVEVDGQNLVLLMDYSANNFEVIGSQNKVVEKIAKDMLTKKHGVNFAYKFNAKMKGTNI